MGCCVAKAPPGSNAKGSLRDSESSFVPIEKKTVYTNAKDVVAKHKDFVVEYQDLTRFHEKYILEKAELGAGAFGVVKKATIKASGQPRAVKIIDKLQMDDTERVRMKYEIDILKNLNHPNIVRLYEVYENKTKIYLVTELCDGCELFDEIAKRKGFSETEAATVLKQLLQSIAYCHANNIAHRDLKPENILIDVNNRGAIKVIDFGTSHHYDLDSANSQMHQMFGTPYYIAPEVLHGNYTEKCDMWSIGVILYIMLCGIPPFNGTDNEIIAKVKKGAWEFRGAAWAEISDEAKDLVKCLMMVKVTDRLSAVDALTHPWIKNKVKNKYNSKLADKAINNLNAFKNESKLKQATLTFMAGHLATKAQQKELRATFAQFDENGDGLIQQDEFINAYRKMYADKDQAEVDERAIEIFTKADVDGSGGIDFGEWCTATINQNQLLNEGNMRAAFALFDKDNSGTIQAEEIAAILGHNIGQEEGVWEAVIREVDVNGDGQIDFEEFQTMLLKLADGQTEEQAGPAQQ